MSDEKSTPVEGESKASRVGLLVQWAGAFLLAAGLFALAAIVAFGSFGRQSEWGWGFIILGLLCLVLWFFGRRQSVKAGRIAGDEYSRQRAILGVNAVASVALLLVALVGLNYIAARRHKVFDLTQSRINSLSPQTHQALDKLKSPVAMTYVWAPTEQAPQLDPSVQSVLEAYKSASDNVRVEYFNASQDLLRLQQMGLRTFSGQPLLVIEPQAKEKESTHTARQEVAVVDEQNVTSAILKINDAQPRVLYFLSGHGELSPTQASMGVGGGSMNGARAALQAQNYTLKNLSLIATKSNIPTDAEAVVAVAPQVDLSPGEEQKIKRYLAGRGRLVLLFQLPRTPTLLSRWKRVVATMNIEMLDGVALEFDPSRMYQGTPQYLIGPLEPARHALLRGVSAGIVFPGVMPLRIRPASPATAATAPTVTPLFETSLNSQNIILQGNRPRQGAPGPLVIAAAAEKSDAGEGAGLRAVIVGNAAFCTDGAFNQFGNTSFFLSAINWVAGNDALVSIPPKEPVANTIAMTSAVQRFAVLFSLFTVPILLLMIGCVVWWKRR